MGRWKWEARLLEHKFPNYTENVRKRINEIVSSEKCEDTSDLVLTGIWVTCSHDLAAVIVAPDQRRRRGNEPVPSELTDSTRDALRSYVDQARDYEAELADSEDDTLEERYLATFREVVETRRLKRDQKAAENDRWAFFNEPEAAADFQRWRGRVVTPAQAVALSLGKDPDVVTPAKLTPYRTVGGSIFREDFKARLDLVEVAVRSGDLADPMTIGSFVAWAGLQKLSLPDGLAGPAGEHLDDDAASWKARYEAAHAQLTELQRSVEDLPSKSVRSLYRLLLGMAIARFQHTTGAKSDAPKIIEGVLEDLEIPLKDDAIRDWLRCASSHLGVQQDKAICWTGVKRPTRSNP